MPIISYFPTGGKLGGGLPLTAVSNIITKTSHEKVYIKWTDPNDLLYEGELLASWAGTLLVRKAGSIPVDIHDGSILLDNTIRNQYQDEYFCDSGLTDGVTYYYKLFPYTKTGVYTNHSDCEFFATPQAVDIGNVSDISAEAAGNGKLAIQWTDPTLHVTDDGLILATWAKTIITVKTGSYAISPDDNDIIYVFTSMTHNAYSSSPLIISNLINDETYYITLFPETTENTINFSDNNKIIGVPNRLQINLTPSQSGTLTYNGNLQTPTWENYDAEIMTLTITGKINAGTYSATFTLDDDYMWNDGSYGEKQVSWSINKASGNLNIMTSSVLLNDSNPSQTVTFSRYGTGQVTAISQNTEIATATVNLDSGTIVINSPNQASGNTTITVSVAEDENYTSPPSQIINIEADFISISNVLNENSWQIISQVSAQNAGANYWSIGDRKAITVSGLVGTVSLSGTYYVYIIGFNHNSEIEGNGITFGMFNNASQNGQYVCLTDNNYGSYSYDGERYFNMSHSAVTNIAWANSDMRSDILGSNASTNIPTSPTGLTLLAALPYDLRAVMKAMSIYTDNIGSNLNNMGDVSQTMDYLPLLSEYEVFGIRTYANSAEQNYQQQYQFFVQGNSTIRYRQTGSYTYDVASWWLRSQAVTYEALFCAVGNVGQAAYETNACSLGIAPIFRV